MLKKLSAIALLFVFLLNAGGYYCFYLGLRYQSGMALRKKIDAEKYHDSETLLLKIPYNLPYQVNRETFERIDGEFERNGEIFKLVKHRVERDTLYVVYIRDHKGTDLFKSLAEFVQSRSDASEPMTALKFIENVIKDFMAPQSALQTAATGWCQAFYFADSEDSVSPIQMPVVSPPPDSML